MTTYHVVQPEGLPDDQKTALIQHLNFSSALKEMWLKGDAIIEGIYNKKRAKTIYRRRVIKNEFIRKIIRGIRRFMKYEVLRSCLEGLLFEQVTYLNEPKEIKFKLENVPSDLSMTHVYFSRNLWEFETYEKEAILDQCEDLTESDIALLLCYMMNHERLLKHIVNYVSEYNGQDRLKWKTRILKQVKSILRIQNPIKEKLFLMLEEFIKST